MEMSDVMIYKDSKPLSSKEQDSNRYEELDSLRGIAALVVFFGHILLIFNGSRLINFIFGLGPLRIAVAGTEAVMLFFILSGFVLSLPFYQKNNFNFAAYTIKRVCRIYLPYIFAVLLAFICKELFYDGPIPYLSKWFNGIWSTDISSRELINHFTLLTTFISHLNVVVWSLVHEMRISLIFPFLMFLLIKVGSTSKGIGIALLCSALSVIFVFFTNAQSNGVELFATLHFIALFIIGSLLAKHRNILTDKYSQLSNKLKITIFIIGIILFVYVHPSLPLRKLVPHINGYYVTVIDSWFMSVGASILIISALSSGRFSRLLKNKVINYLGKISYSLYLTHLTVLTSFVHLLSKMMPIWSICLLAIVVTILLSSIMYHIVEKSSIKLGKKLAEMLSISMVIRIKKDQRLKGNL